MTETNELKLCKDCKHIKNKNYGGKYEFSTCGASSYTQDSVSGDKAFMYCSTMRELYYRCSPQALLFEPKLSLWYKLKNIFRKPL